MYVCIDVCMYVYIYICMHMEIFVLMRSILLYVYTRIHMYIHIYKNIICLLISHDNPVALSGMAFARYNGEDGFVAWFSMAQ